MRKTNIDFNKIPKHIMLLLLIYVILTFSGFVFLAIYLSTNYPIQLLFNVIYSFLITKIINKYLTYYLVDEYGNIKFKFRRDEFKF